MASTGAFDLSALQLYADDTECLLICCHTDCGFALSVSRSQATSHLRDKHNISKKLRDGLTRYLKHGHPYPFRNPADVAPRDDGSQVHRMLRIHDGFACRACPYRTINYAEYSRHASKEHLNGRNASCKRVTWAIFSLWYKTLFAAVGVGKCTIARRHRQIEDSFWYGWATRLILLDTRSNSLSGRIEISGAADWSSLARSSI